MSRTEKYNFIVTKNQFHHNVNFLYEDSTETKVIDCFEETILNLKNINKKIYSMIELGSNFCFINTL